MSSTLVLTCPFGRNHVLLSLQAPHIPDPAEMDKRRTAVEAMHFFNKKNAQFFHRERESECLIIATPKRKKSILFRKTLDCDNSDPKW